MMKIIEENMGLKDIQEEKKLEMVYMLNAYYVDHTKHIFDGWMHDKYILYEDGHIYNKFEVYATPVA